MISRGNNFESVPLNLVGSSIFGRYPKISSERTYNMFESDGWLVPYAGYKVAIPNSKFNNGVSGRAIHTSTKFNKLIIVIDSNVYLASLNFNQTLLNFNSIQVMKIGTLMTTAGVVYIAENNKPQILFSDNISLYLYDPTLTPAFKTIGTNFVPGFIDFQDTYFLAAATQDQNYTPPATNVWRLSASNDGTTWPSTASSIGLLQTKSDVTQAVIRVPSRGNTAYVMGKTVTEQWFDSGLQLFPYQRNTSQNYDYGCLNPATIAYTDEVVVWLAQNDKTGPIIVYSTGSFPEKITTDGIDYLFSTLTNPSDSQGFIYRQDGHLFYHINFYTDNLSLFYDFNTKKFYHACDENLNYFIANEVAFYNNQYYFVTKNDGNLYAFDTAFTTYNGAEIPRIRTCRNIRKPSQEYFVANDVGFTIETGETNYQQQDLGPILLITEDGQNLITEGSAILLITEDGNYIETEDGMNILISEQSDPTDFNYLESEQDANTGYGILSLPRVDLSISIDGGASFGSDMPYNLNPIGQRKNRLMWWQLGLANDMVCQFKFWGMGRFVAYDGIINTRQ
jgi:hypothetical protein